MEQPVISVDNLTVRFYTSAGVVYAVEDVSFDIRKKEIFALVGESGCGKSTTALALMRLIAEPGKITAGEIFFRNQDILKISESQMTKVRGKEVGMIFQNPLDSLNAVYRVGHQISEAILIDKIPKKEAWQKTLEIIKDVKIADSEQRAKSYPFELSGGMRQRIMIAMMLSRSPELLIADEPTTALDVTIQAQILEIIKDLRKSVQMSVLVITHDFGIVAEIADRVGVMYAGKLVEIGDVFQIFDNSLHPYTKLLMQALPRIAKAAGRLKTIPGDVPSLIEPPQGCRFRDRCPETIDRCREIEPQMIEYEPGHFCACHVI
jgi:oligopeptide/dipeptide ABC transporter ATP-binding protein